MVVLKEGSITYKDVKHPDNLLFKISVSSSSDELNIHLLTGKSLGYRTTDIVYSISLPHNRNLETYTFKIIDGTLTISKHSDGKVIYDKSVVKNVTGLKISSPGPKVSCMLVCGNENCGIEWEKKSSQTWVWVLLGIVLILLSSTVGAGIYIRRKNIKNQLHVKPL